MSKPKKTSALSVQPGVEDTSDLNPNLKGRLKKNILPPPEELVKGILAGDITTLGRAITLIESTKADHQQLAEKVINACLPHSGNAFRMGITGIPGVGKSSFIESFGNYLIGSHRKKVAVLAVDPSSGKNKGSILGDKTRMERLSQNKHAFIRPSPSAGSLGGVARKTRETAILCEAAGFNVILIETVGVGQSETAVKSMVDYFLLLLLPGAGDELQGIKRGIMEMADAIAINKADGDNAKRAEIAKADVNRALHLYPADARGWQVPVKTCSALEVFGIDDIWEDALTFERHMKTKGWFDTNRQEQSAWWLRETITESLINQFNKKPKVKNRLAQLEEEIKHNRISPFTAARELVEIFLNE